MKKWYADYWAQTWYRNTFLVRRPSQIAQAVDHDREWNNLFDCGCNFTCLAMIIGIDPAHLASALSSEKFFYADPRMPAIDLNGRKGGLVWDRNAPHRWRRSFVLRHIWHQRLGSRATIRVTYKDEIATTSYEKGATFIRTARKKRQHVICGPEDHAHLVAGTNGADFFVWDPDDHAVEVEATLAGEFSMRKLFQQHERTAIEFLAYDCHVTQDI